MVENNAKHTHIANSMRLRISRCLFRETVDKFVAASTCVLCTMCTPEITIANVANAIVPKHTDNEVAEVVKAAMSKDIRQNAMVATIQTCKIERQKKREVRFNFPPR